eukprot:6476468-Amphidinium_carterae.1
MHNVHIEEDMDESAKSVDAMDLKNIQDANVTEYVQNRDNKNQKNPTEDEREELENYSGLTMANRSKQDEITSISQVLKYVPVHSTKSRSNSHSIFRQIMRTSNDFETWIQLNLHYAGGTELQNFHYSVTIVYYHVSTQGCKLTDTSQNNKTILPMARKHQSPGTNGKRNHRRPRQDRSS